MTLLVAIAAPASAQLRAQPFVSGLHLPLEFVPDPTTPSVQYVVEKGGRIRVIRSGVLLSTPFLDLSAVMASAGEQGLLGLAFAPDYATSRRFFVNFTDAKGNTVVSRFKRSTANALAADVTTRLRRRRQARFHGVDAVQRSLVHRPQLDRRNHDAAMGHWNGAIQRHPGAWRLRRRRQS
jgi:glucose/arabinose dehydrogenase